MAMSRPIVVFEDERASDLYPLTLTRPVFDLRCGIRTLIEKLLVSLRGQGKGWWATDGDEPLVQVHIRGYLQDATTLPLVRYAELFKAFKTVTLINGRVLMDARVLESLSSDWQGKYVSQGQVVAASVSSDLLEPLERSLGRTLDGEIFEDLPEKPIEADLISYPWDLVRLNGSQIEADFRMFKGLASETDLPDGVYLVNPDLIRIGRDVRLGPGVVIDASDGCVFLDDGVVVMPNASLKGPLYIGKRSVVKMGATIYGETSIGPVSKVGGEIAESIIQGYSNKQHEGFLGHSYLGEWVNLGAGTNTSDMKNNYSSVRVTINGKAVDTGELFVGLFMGDHSKCGIGTVFNTGTVVGVCCNIFGAGYPPKYIPSFCWGGASVFAEHDLEKALETARRAMRRRKRELSEAERALLKHIFETTSKERIEFLQAHRQ